MSWRALWQLAARTLVRAPAAEARLVARQAYELGNRSALFVTVIMAFVGAIMMIQAATQAQRIIGDLSTIGPGFLQLLVREFGPTIVALMVAARYGAGVAAELGTMSITEQLDALRLSGADPVPYLVVPRVGGGLVAMLPVVVLGVGVAFCAGAVVGRSMFGIGWDTYFNLRLVTGVDVTVGVAKSLAFGAAVPLIACHAGLCARGGAPGVGRATTAAVIGASIGVLFLDLVIGGLGYLAAR